jgi:hypothetical protein
VKADKAQSKLVSAMLELNVKWGNFQKAPALQKEPYKINVDDNTAVYVTVITHPAQQCSVCGTWDKSDYCPACRGEVVNSDTVKADL